MGRLTIDNFSDELVEYLNTLGLTEGQVNTIIENIMNETIGSMNDLATENKENLIGAINEILQNNNNKNGDLTGLQTENKENLVGAINELFQNVSNGKNLIAEALTDRGVEASANETFLELANKILSIPQGVELPMKTPVWTPNIDTVTATLDTQDGLFTSFRVNGGNWQASNIFSGLTGGVSYTFEGMYAGTRVSSISSNAPKANQSAPGKCTSSNVTQTAVTITAPSGCMIRYNGTNYNSPHTFSGSASAILTFYAYKPATANKNESPVGAALSVQLRGIGMNSPGPEHLISGTSAQGYFGEVNLTTLDVIKPGLTTLTLIPGIADTSPITFLKFIQNGKTIYISKTPLYDRSAAVAERPYTIINTPAQSYNTTTVTINGRNYTMRLPRIGSSNNQHILTSEQFSYGCDWNLYGLAWSNFAYPEGHFILCGDNIEYGDDYMVFMYTGWQGSGRSTSFWTAGDTNQLLLTIVLELQ